MTGLLVGTFAVFWIHTLLWMFRGFVENREKRRALMGDGQHHRSPAASRSTGVSTERHIFLHLLVIISFLGPGADRAAPQVRDQHWAKVLMDFYGGTYYAGLIHRACAGHHLLLLLRRHPAEHRLPLLPQGHQGELPAAAVRSRFPLPQPAGHPGHRRDGPLVLVPGAETDLRALDLLGKI